MDSKEINLNFDNDFRQIILKLANTYEPSFDLSKTNFKNRYEYIEEIANLLSQDFAHQLYPLIEDYLHDQFDRYSQ